MTTKPKTNQHLSAALGLLVSTIEKHGNWDDGCFYYNGISASELQEPLRLAKLMLKDDFLESRRIAIERDQAMVRDRLAGEVMKTIAADVWQNAVAAANCADPGAEDRVAMVLKTAANFSYGLADAMLNVRTDG